MAEWNAVFVDGSWRLLDPFWGSCVKNQEGHVTSNTSDWFLFTEPKQFLYSHLPEKPEWQLVEQPISKHDFEKQVLKFLGDLSHLLFSSWYTNGVSDKD